jgi:hypothetical protein
MRPRPAITQLRYDQAAAAHVDWIRRSVSPWPHDTAQAKAARKERAASDFFFFCTNYLPHYFTSSFEDFHREWYALATAEGFRPVAAAREHGKTTFFTFAVPLYNLLFTRHKFQIIISETSDPANRFLSDIRAELAANARILHDFGNLEGPIWAEDEIVTSTGCNIKTRTQGQQVRGLKYRQYRPGYIIIDDLESDKSVASPKRTASTLRWINRTVIPAAEAGGTVLMVGNKFAASSVLSQLLAAVDDQGRPKHGGVEYPAILDYGLPNQRPLFPSRWPMARLDALRRSIGTAAFLAEMQHITTHGDNIRTEWIQHYTPADLPENLEIATFCDPSSTSTGDCKAVVTVGLDRSTMAYYVLHAYVRRASQGDMFNACYDQYTAYSPAVIGIEDNSYKDFLAGAIETEAKERGAYLPWRRIHRSGNKLAMIMGALAVPAEYGKLYICRQHSDQEVLYQQLIALGSTYPDDGPDALAGAVELLRTSPARKVGYVPLPMPRKARGRGERRGKIKNKRR